MINCPSFSLFGLGGVGFSSMAAFRPSVGEASLHSFPSAMHCWHALVKKTCPSIEFVCLQLPSSFSFTGWPQDEQSCTSEAIRNSPPASPCDLQAQASSCYNLFLAVLFQFIAFQDFFDFHDKSVSFQDIQFLPNIMRYLPPACCSYFYSGYCHSNSHLVVIPNVI